MAMLGQGALACPCPWLGLNFSCREGTMVNFWHQLTWSVEKIRCPVLHSPFCSCLSCLEKMISKVPCEDKLAFGFSEPFSDLYGFWNRLDFGVRLSKRPVLLSTSICYFANSQVLKSRALLA